MTDCRMKINGKCGTAICYAKVIEPSAVEQIKTMCDYEPARGSRIRIMPDVHAGAGCTIGTTMTITDKVVPNVVGVDIGCGMYTVKLAEKEIDFEKLDEVAHYIPSGMNVWEGRHERFDLQRFYCFRDLKDTKWLERSLGTLGGGNHFIEVDRGSDESLYLVIHSGSRNLGKQVAEYYQHIAIELNEGKEEYYKKRDAIITEYKATGRRSEIQEALKQLKAEKTERTIPDALCYVYGDWFKKYLADIVVCQEFAVKNRELIAKTLLERADLHAIDSFHTIHNYIDADEMILRKGAIAAHKGQRVLIPISMRDGSILGIGRGNADWNYSAPHGAGRIMSRHEAREKLSVEAFEKTMTGIYSTSVNESTLDEAPMAYKPIDAILGVIDETVEVADILKPIYNFKASEEARK